MRDPLSANLSGPAAAVLNRTAVGTSLAVLADTITTFREAPL
jgi:hypothetical protein